MNLWFKTLILSSAALCATAVFADSQARVNVPFSFTVKGQPFPAGPYEVSLDFRDNFVTLASKSQPVRQMIWRVEPTDAGKSPVMVDFRRSGSDYALERIQIGVWTTPKIAPRSRHGVSATTSIAGE